MRWSIAVLAALALAACNRSEDRGGPEAAPDTGAVEQADQPGMMPGTTAPEEGAEQPTGFPEDTTGTGEQRQGEDLGAGGEGALEPIQGDEAGEDVKSGEPDGGALEEEPGATTPEESEQRFREGGQEPTGGDLGAGGNGG